MKLFFNLVFVLVLALANTQLAAREGVSWPDGMSVVALTKKGWRMYIVKPKTGRINSVNLGSEPRSPVYSPSLGLVAYVTPYGDIMLHDLKTGKERVLLAKEGDVAYTNLFLSVPRKSLIAVELLQGRSSRTRIIEIKLESGRTDILSRQRSAQFDPKIHGQNLYYSMVHCVENCAGRYVHEIWVKNMISGDAYQLTLLNSLAQQPAVSSNENHLYISSDRNEGTRIWKCALDHQNLPLECVAVSSGGVSDTSPAVDRNGALYFIRLLPDGRKVVMASIAGKSAEYVELPSGFKDIRDLEIGE